jgi:hypothetical protein
MVISLSYPIVIMYVYLYRLQPLVVPNQSLLGMSNGNWIDQHGMEIAGSSGLTLWPSQRY